MKWRCYWLLVLCSELQIGSSVTFLDLSESSSPERAKEVCEKFVHMENEMKVLLATRTVLRTSDWLIGHVFRSIRKFIAWEGKGSLWEVRTHGKWNESVIGYSYCAQNFRLAHSVTFLDLSESSSPERAKEVCEKFVHMENEMKVLLATRTVLRTSDWLIGHVFRSIRKFIAWEGKGSLWEVRTHGKWNESVIGYSYCAQNFRLAHRSRF